MLVYQFSVSQCSNAAFLIPSNHRRHTTIASRLEQPSIYRYRRYSGSSPGQQRFDIRRSTDRVSN